ncbi:Sperm acrosomal protein, partial [Zancudomyces culisetae]
TEETTTEETTTEETTTEETTTEETTTEETTTEETTTEETTTEETTTEETTTEETTTEETTTEETTTEETTTEETTTEETTTEETTTEEVTTEETTTEETTTEETTTEVTTTEETTTSTSSTCDSVFTYPAISADSSAKNKNYDFSKEILVPCDTQDFELTATVSSTSDLFIAYMDNLGYYSPNGVVEAQFGLYSGIYSVKKTKYIFVKRSHLITRDTPQSVKVTYHNSVMQTYVDGNLRSRFTVLKFNISKMAVASFTGTALVSDITFYCQPVNC